MQQRILILTLLASLAFAGCVGNAATADLPPASTASLPILAGDFTLTAPATVPAGLVEVTLTNVGTELHHVVFYRIEPGRSLEELRQALEDGASVPPAWATAYGGPNVAVPGAPTRAFLKLDVGEYVLVCIIPSADDHRMHFTKGMMTTLSVLPAVGPVARPPAPDATATLRDFSFSLDKPMEAGEQFVRIVNEGSVTHELVAFELFGNATTFDLVDFIEGKAEFDAPPGRPVGGVTPLSPGKEATVPMTFAPGRYTFICFDLAGMAEPHFLHGMIHEFAVA